MQRWEYKVVSMREGSYTDTLNEFGRDGWELVSVASDVRASPASAGRDLPTPQAFGKLGQAASKLNKLERGDPAGPEAGATFTTLLWVLRRPLDDEF
ncbi:MAG: DUF4177 domain-containing protein [Gaiellaceae bacterium]